MEGRAAVAAMVVAVALAAVPAGGLAQAGNSSSMTPGEHFAGVVGVQETEVQGEMASRTFRLRLDRAESPSARAAVVADQVSGAREHLGELERRRERLQRQRANGTISEGQYRARMARLLAESRALQRQLNRTADVSRGVPDETLRKRGVGPTELDRLRDAAGGLTGPEAVAAGRELAGADPGGPPNNSARGPPVRAANDSGRPDGANGSTRGPPADAGAAGRKHTPPTDGVRGGGARPSAGAGNGTEEREVGSGPPDAAGRPAAADDAPGAAGNRSDAASRGNRSDSAPSGNRSRAGSATDPGPGAANGSADRASGNGAG